MIKNYVLRYYTHLNLISRVRETQRNFTQNEDKDFKVEKKISPLLNFMNFACAAKILFSDRKSLITRRRSHQSHQVSVSLTTNDLNHKSADYKFTTK